MADPVIENIVMTGSEQAFTTPARCFNVAFQANGGTITIAKTSGGAVWTLRDGATLPLRGHQYEQMIFYINGAAGTLEVLCEIGLDT